LPFRSLHIYLVDDADSNPCLALVLSGELIWPKSEGQQLLWRGQTAFATVVVEENDLRLWREFKDHLTTGATWAGNCWCWGHHSQRNDRPGCRHVSAEQGYPLGTDGERIGCVLNIGTAKDTAIIG
jgi:hypothetical protein